MRGSNWTRQRLAGVGWPGQNAQTRRQSGRVIGRGHKVAGVRGGAEVAESHVDFPATGAVESLGDPAPDPLEGRGVAGHPGDVTGGGVEP